MRASDSGVDGPPGSGAHSRFAAADERGISANPVGPTNGDGAMIDGGTVGGSMTRGNRQRPACASGHGPENCGRIHLMQLRTMTTPDIRHVELRNLSELNGGQRPYDIDDFRQQVVNAGHPEGTEVKAGRAHWQMLDSDIWPMCAPPSWPCLNDRTVAGPARRVCTARCTIADSWLGVGTGARSRQARADAALRITMANAAAVYPPCKA